MIKLRSFLCVATLALAAAAHADDSAYEQVQALLDAGQSKQAVKQAKAYLAQPDNAQDVQMSFILANALAASGNKGEAEKLLRQMCDDYPELAEPWNNLAVMHASAGKLDEAAAALQEALRRRPDYATAWENLGDVRVREVLDAWQHAVALDAGLRARLDPHLKSLRAMAAQRSAAPKGKAPQKAADKDSSKAAEKALEKASAAQPAEPQTGAKADAGKAAEKAQEAASAAKPAATKRNTRTRKNAKRRAAAR